MESINDLLQNADFSYFSKDSFRTDYGHFMGPSANIFKSNGLLGTIWSGYKIIFVHLWYYQNRITIEQDSFPGLESYSRNINTLIELANIDTTKVILLSQPNIYNEIMDEDTKSACWMVSIESVGKYKKWSYNTGFNGMKKYNSKIKEISQNKNVYFIDLEAEIPKSLVYFWDDVHYRDTTFNIISKFLAKEIIRQKIILP
jgi:hypothetical protein